MCTTFAFRRSRRRRSSGRCLWAKRPKEAAERARRERAGALLYRTSPPGSMIDLRSDTATRPTQAMREAIARAVVGDEQKREDPTVNELERRGAELLGHEAAVYLPTATMANQIALRILAEPGDEVLAEENSHVLLSELGGPAVHSGLVTRGLRGVAGRFAPDQVRAAYRDRTSMHVSPTRLVVVENTHNSSGGRIWPLEEIEAMAATCRELDMRIHLDGARLMNAAVASGTPAGPTIATLLSHASGIQREVPGSGWGTLEFPGLEQVLGSLGEVELVLEGGAEWHYSNLGFVLLGEVVARLAGVPIERYIDERVLGPLGLEETTWA